jgi:hypothetical protein
MSAIHSKSNLEQMAFDNGYMVIETSNDPDTRGYAKVANPKGQVFEGSGGDSEVALEDALQKAGLLPRPTLKQRQQKAIMQGWQIGGDYAWLEGRLCPLVWAWNQDRRLGIAPTVAPTVDEALEAMLTTLGV